MTKDVKTDFSNITVKDFLISGLKNPNVSFLIELFITSLDITQSFDHVQKVIARISNFIPKEVLSLMIGIKYLQ